MVPPLIAETTTGDGPAGETVWVKQGKTDHLAQLMVPSSLCQKDFNEHGKVWVKWVTAGHYEAVPADSITFLESGRRHHGRVSNHGGVVTASKFAKTAENKNQAAVEKKQPAVATAATDELDVDHFMNGDDESVNDEMEIESSKSSQDSDSDKKRPPAKKSTAGSCDDDDDEDESDNNYCESEDDSHDSSKGPHTKTRRRQFKKTKIGANDASGDLVLHFGDNDHNSSGTSTIDDDGDDDESADEEKLVDLANERTRQLLISKGWVWKRKKSLSSLSGQSGGNQDSNMNIDEIQSPEVPPQQSPEMRKKKGKKPKVAQPRLTVKSRVRITKRRLYHGIVDHQRASLLQKRTEHLAQNCWIYGTVSCGSKSEGWTIDFEFAGRILIRDRNAFVVVKKGGDEPRYSAKALQQLEDDSYYLEIKDPFDNSSEEIKSEDDFCKMSRDEIKKAKRVEIHLSKKPSDTILWEILEESEFASSAQFDSVAKNLWNGPKVSDRVTRLDEKSHWDIFFKYFWPPMKGKAKLMDEYFANHRARGHLTWKRRKIRFNDPTAADPDWRLKQGVAIVIAGAGEPYRGVENFWKSGSDGYNDMLRGRVPYPDFGKYMEYHMFTLFKRAIPRMWCEKKYWYLPYGREPWAMFLPFAEAWEKTNAGIFDLDPSDPTLALIGDESFSFRVPKASKDGGMPNICFEPRKPRGLGAQLKNVAVVGPDTIILNEPVMNAEHQHAKKFSDSPSLIPGKRGGKIYEGTAYCLRHALKVRCAKSFVGDAGFGSVEAVVHLQKDPQLPNPVESFFVVKTLNHAYPKRVLEAVLKARYCRDILGKWVVMMTEIEGAEVVAMAYAWGGDFSRIAYFVSSCADTSPSEIPHTTNFQDANDEKQERASPQPKLAEFIFRQLSIIDEHNNKRQGDLNLEATWPTKDSWFRLFTTFVGMSVTNQRNFLEYRKVVSLTVNEEANVIANGLKKVRVQHVTAADDANEEQELIRIATGPLDAPDIHKRISQDQEVRYGRSLGSGIQRSCFVCRRYYEKPVDSCFMCSHCGTCLCKKDRRQTDSKRTMTCLEEHHKSSLAAIRCDQLNRKRKMPSELRLWPAWKDPRGGKLFP